VARLESVSGRILPATVQRLDRIADALSERRPGEVVKRADTLRAAIERGVEVLERELGIAATEPPPASKPAKPRRKPT
jgi:hypothetical protein